MRYSVSLSTSRGRDVYVSITVLNSLGPAEGKQGREENDSSDKADNAFISYSSYNSSLLRRG